MLYILYSMLFAQQDICFKIEDTVNKIVNTKWESDFWPNKFFFSKFKKCNECAKKIIYLDSKDDPFIKVMINRSARENFFETDYKTISVKNYPIDFSKWIHKESFFNTKDEKVYLQEFHTKNHDYIAFRQVYGGEKYEKMHLFPPCSMETKK